MPLTDSQDYDLIVDNEGLKKVQVKTTSKLVHDRYYQCTIAMKGGTKGLTFKYFDPSTVDILFIVTPVGVYEIPSNVITVSTVLSLGNKWKEYQVSWE